MLGRLRRSAREASEAFADAALHARDGRVRALVAKSPRNARVVAGMVRPELQGKGNEMRRSLTCVRSWIAGISLLAVAGGAGATPVVFSFDGVASGSAANDAVTGSGFRFDLAALLPLLDAFGDPIPGTEAYRVDPDAVDDVRVNDPNSRLYGNAPSPVNALDGIDQGILLTFESPVDLASFAVTLDLSTFGFPGSFDIVFQNANGAALSLLPTQQSVAGFVASLAGPLAGVASIYLPSGAFYDNLTLEVVPEPGTFGLAALGLAGLAAANRRAAERRRGRR